MTDIVSLGAERGTYHLNAAKHNVVLADKTYQGEIKVGITFTATQVRYLFPSVMLMDATCIASVLEAWSLIGCLPTPDFRFRKMEEQLEGGGTVALISERRRPW